jgi:hypothetical protein
MKEKEQAKNALILSALTTLALSSLAIGIAIPK